MGKGKNWFYELDEAKQVEYCQRLKGKKFSKYCTLDGKPQPQSTDAKTTKSLAEKVQSHQAEGTGGDHAYYDVNNSEHEWAKKSEIKNIGEDISGAARHRRNEHRTWGNFEDMMTEKKEELLKADVIKKAQLEKMSPIDFNELAESIKDNDLVKHQELLAIKQMSACLPGMAKDSKKEYFLQAFSIVRKHQEEAIRKFKANESVDIGLMQSNLRSELIEQYKILQSNPEIKHWDAFLLADCSNKLMRTKKNSPVGVVSKLYTEALIEAGDGNYNSVWEAKDSLKKVSNGTATEADIAKAKKVNDLAIKKMGLAIRGKATTQREKPAETVREDSFYKNVKLERSGDKQKFTSLSSGQDHLASKIGFRGIQFGNSMPDKERESHVISAAQAFHDMSKATGISNKSLSLGGKLGIAFGARGRSKAMAHYEPSENVINLTRRNGFGALAHEWGHAMDNYARGRESKVLNEKVTEIKKALNGNFLKRMRESKEYKALSYGQKVYFSSSDEVFARAFEKYTQIKTERAGNKNTYLVAGVASELWPTEAEIKELEPMFEQLVSKLNAEE